MKKHTFKVGDTVEVFKDPMTEKIHEGVGKITKIHKEDEDVVDCDVRFYKNVHLSPRMEEESFRRQIKR